MKKVLSKLKKHFKESKKSFTILITIMVFLFCSLTYKLYSANAIQLIAKEIIYYPTKSGLDSNNVQDAINELYAKTMNQTYTSTSYLVKFESNDGSTVTSLTIENGEKISKPIDPTKEGYKFGGWYKESNFTNLWNFAEDTVTDNVTLYAKWVVDSSSSSGGNDIGEEDISNEINSSNDSDSKLNVDNELKNIIKEYIEKEVPKTEKDKIKDELFSEAEDIYVTDLQIKDTDGKEINLNGKEVIVTIPFPNGMNTTDNIKIYEIINGEKKEITFSIDDGKIVFKTSTMGRYAIVKYSKNIDVDNPKTGDINLPVIIMALVVTLLILVGSIMYIIKVRKNK